MKSGENLDLLSALISGHNANRPRAGKSSELLSDLFGYLSITDAIDDREIGPAAWVISGVEQLTAQSNLPSRHWDRGFTDASDLYACLKACRLLMFGKGEPVTARVIERHLYTQYFDVRCNQRQKRQFEAAWRRIVLRPRWLRERSRLEALALIFQTDVRRLLTTHANLPHPKLRIAAVAAIYCAIETA